MKPETLELLGSIGSMLEDIGVREDFLDRTPFTRELSPVLANRNENLLHNQGNNQVKRKPIGWRRTFANYTSGRGLMSGIYKELKK